MSWLCKCGLINSGLNQTCAATNSQRLGSEHYQISSNTPDFLMSIVAVNGVNSMTPQEELFSKFYNQEKILIKDMDTVQLREHREQLSTIAFEAKARLVASDDESRERKAKNGNKDWTLSPTEADVNVTDAINAVKIRSARMSKMDKLKQQLLTAGIEEALANEMVANLERKATDQSAKTITFKPAKGPKPIVISISQPAEPAEPFNPANLKFGG